MIEKNLYSVNGKGIVADNIEQAIEMYKQWAKTQKDLILYREVTCAQKIDKFKAGLAYDLILWQV